MTELLLWIAVHMLRAAGGPLYAWLFCGPAKRKLRKQGSRHLRALSVPSNVPSYALMGREVQVLRTQESFTFDAHFVLQYQCIRVLKNSQGIYFYYRFQSDGSALIKPIPESTAKVLLKGKKPRRPATLAAPGFTLS
jgi:hypothetical protein